MGKKILIIDDDHEFIEAMATLLEVKGYEVEGASEGKEGVAKAVQLCPDLILLDVMMTRKTEGFDVAQDLAQNANTQKIPVILITGIRRDMNLSFGFEPDKEWLPVRAVLEKPVKPETLLEAVRSALNE